MSVEPGISVFDQALELFPSEVYWVAELNYMQIGIASNGEVLPGGEYIYHRKATRTEFEANHYRIWLHARPDLNEEETAWLSRQSDRSFRNDRFRSGFYVTHHFGKPAYLFTGPKGTIVVGSTLSKLLWAYFTKYLLTIEAESRGDLHIKAAAVEIDGAGLLVVGRGSGGKTVFVADACRRGAKFVANTHCVLAPDLAVTGVKSPMRVRDTPIFAEMIAASGGKPHIESDEYTIRPDEVFRASAEQTTVSAVIILDYNPRLKPVMEYWSSEEFVEFARLFAFPVVTYGLKDDILYWKAGDHRAMVRAVSSMTAKLVSISKSLRIIYVNADVTRDASWSQLVSMISDGGEESANA